MNNTTLPMLLERYFNDRLRRQLQASAHTISSYKDTFRLFLNFSAAKVGKNPVKLTFQELDADMVMGFLDHITQVRHNTNRSRNTRLAALKSFYNFCALIDTSLINHCNKILAIPKAVYIKVPVNFLTKEEMDALLQAPQRSTLVGRRDHLMILLCFQTGLRLSELLRLTPRDLGPGQIRCFGKGRKLRDIPVRPETMKLLNDWIRERALLEHEAIFTSSRNGLLMSPDAFQAALKKYARKARALCPSLKKKRISPHVLRHSFSMEFLNHGNSQAVLSLWLGHESVLTTDTYVHGDPRLKERALARLESSHSKGEDVDIRYRPPTDALLQMLEKV